VLPVSTYPWVPVGRGPVFVLHKTAPPQELSPEGKVMMLAARACGMDAAARTTAAEIPTKMPEARFIELMEVRPPLHNERNRD
jgi:hypothetical protein